MKPVKKLTNNEKAVLRVTDAINAGQVLMAYNALDREKTTVGSYHEAVDRGIHFAVIGYRTGHEIRTRTAEEAATSFVARVGSTRAREAAISQSKKS